MIDEVSELLDEIRSLADDVRTGSQDLYSRLNGGDVPWNTGCDIQGEFCGDGVFGKSADRLFAIEKKLQELLK